MTCDGKPSEGELTDEKDPSVSLIPPVVMMITSAKGGVGKSTVSVNLGAALALSDKRVLLIDCDEANRCLDLLTGLESSITCGLFEVLSDIVPYRDAIFSVPSCHGLFLLPGYSHFSDSSDDLLLSERFFRLFDDIKKDCEASFDYILIDTPGGNPELIKKASSVSDRALVISTGQATSVRSAAKTAVLLSECGIPDIRLIVNQFIGGNTKKQRLASEFSLISLIDEIGAQLLGVVPYDSDVLKMQNDGLLFHEVPYQKSAFSSAFRNIASRILYQNIPLFSGIKGYF